MLYEVLKDFFDKNTGNLHIAGSYYETKSVNRAKELQEGDFISTKGQEKQKNRTTKKPNE